MADSMRLLLVAPSGDAGKAVGRLLAESEDIEFAVCARTEVADVVHAALEGRFDLLVLAMEAIGAGGLERIGALAGALPMVPLIVVSREADEGAALEAIRRGAQDCLDHAALAGSGAVGALRRIVERHGLMRRRHERDTRQAVSSTATDVLDRLPLGVMILDGRGNVLVVNSKARQIIASGDGLVVDPSNGNFRAESADETRALLSLVKRTVFGEVGADEGCALTISRSSMKQPLCLMVTPLGTQGPGDDRRRNGVAIFMSDPEDGIEIDEDVLRDLYGLTRVEARLALGLVRGKQLDELAKASRVSVHTVRSQLKHIFRKTGSNRQAELVKLLLTGPAAIRGEHRA